MRNWLIISKLYTHDLYAQNKVKKYFFFDSILILKTTIVKKYFVSYYLNI